MKVISYNKFINNKNIKHLDGINLDFTNHCIEFSKGYDIIQSDYIYELYGNNHYILNDCDIISNFSFNSENKDVKISLSIGFEKFDIKKIENLLITKLKFYPINLYFDGDYTNATIKYTKSYINYHYRDILMEHTVITDNFIYYNESFTENNEQNRKDLKL